ncbi:aminotransferase class I/II-fold pyridoxal phosphate-dependent enzyme [Saccharopolyspora phatthalungensis]|uniref:Aspartate/methionine/tyrosine aminotransferase n=1 Tax=Saccharopolyspora phatthalungensis TaxID=664693 RepID=A0A840QD32_9PSEU|nr:aminotransferase class I/II-fold pyridoxal phosphate-dependent enzyme [Saccharopolyspora phatthalungensis]MBB5158306.1 aspartate/methionine/tyrosine aminotransferase [Saccharopolyspora phatthalungensis]
MSGLPEAINRLAMPELADQIGVSLRDAERELENAPGPDGLLDATYADTHRFPPPEWALPTFSAAAGGDGMTYTPYRGDRGVRESVAHNVSTALGIPTTGAAEVILTPGTQGALFTALASLISPGDLVLLPDPDYLSTERMLRYFGARVLRIPMLWPQSPAGHGRPRPALDLQALEDAAKQRPRLLVFSHPNNPTGAIYGADTIDAISELAQRYDFHVIADELYSRLVYDGEEFFHLAAKDGMAQRTVTLLGPSKTESLSGYRLGVAVAPAKLVEAMEDVQSCTALRAPSYAQHLLGRWIGDDGEFVGQRIKEYEALRNTTVAKINASSVMRVRPSFGTAYVFPEVLTGACDQDVALTLKKDAGVVVNPGYQFGPAGSGHMRLCFAQDEAVWDAALDRILDVVARVAPRP